MRSIDYIKLIIFFSFCVTQGQAYSLSYRPTCISFHSPLKFVRSSSTGVVHVLVVEHRHSERQRVCGRSGRRVRALRMCQKIGRGADRQMTPDDLRQFDRRRSEYSAVCSVTPNVAE